MVIQGDRFVQSTSNSLVGPHSVVVPYRSEVLDLDSVGGGPSRCPSANHRIDLVYIVINEIAVLVIDVKVKVGVAVTGYDHYGLDSAFELMSVCVGRVGKDALRCLGVGHLHLRC